MKKVLMIAHVASMIDLFNRENIELLKKKGYQVHVACNFTEGNVTSQEQVNLFKVYLESIGVEYFQINFPRKLSKIYLLIQSYIRIIKLLSRNKYKLIHCQSPIAGALSRLAATSFRDKNLKVLYVAHGFHFYKGCPWPNKIYYLLERLLSHVTDCLVTINEEDYKISKKKLHCNNVRKINGVGVDIHRNSNIKATIVTREELELREEDFIIISVGELNKNKNHEVIIKALGSINDKSIHYLICGQGPLEGKLKLLIKKYQLEGNVHLLGYRNDVKELLQLSDLKILPSFREGLPVALMEAMSYGLPIICSKIRGNTDLITHGENGYLVTKNSLDQYSNYIIKLKKNDDERKKMGGLSELRIKEYDIESVKKTMSDIYDVILNEGYGGYDAKKI